MIPSRILNISDDVQSSFEPIMQAIGPARQALAGLKEVVAIRPGYYLPARGKPLPAVVVAVMPSTPRRALKTAKLAKQLGVRITVQEATPEEQIAAVQRRRAAGAFAIAPPARSAFERLLSDEDAAIAFAPPKTGNYEPLEPSALLLVDEPMKVTLCVSPEAGWSELESFLAGTQERLTIAMYQFTAPHVFAAVQNAVTPAGRTMELVLHPVPEDPRAGIKAQDLKEQDIIDTLRGAMATRFQMSWATLISRTHPDGLWASAYHIKVAVRDGTSFWLSSGNWQSSNQPALHLFGDHPDKAPTGLQRTYNREYHAIIEDVTLAVAYETYIKRDHALTSAGGSAEPFALPDLFVPEAEPEEPIAFAAPPQFFAPLRLERQVKVQPLLTPDNYAEHALALIRSATKSVWFQNQYITFRNNGEDFTEFQLLVHALKDAIDRGCDVRIICRDPVDKGNVDVLLALGFPLQVLRFQRACHNKAIIVDGKIVMFGSHNWSNEGVKTNRDASLIFYDEEIAQYFARVYDYDWKRLARGKALSSQPLVALGDEPAPSGYTRVPWSAVYED